MKEISPIFTFFVDVAQLSASVFICLRSSSLIGGRPTAFATLSPASEIFVKNSLLFGSSLGIVLKLEARIKADLKEVRDSTSK